MAEAHEPFAIFDTKLACKRLARAWRLGFADFLIARLSEELIDRLGAIKRSFAVAVDLSSPGPHLTQALSSLADVVQLAPIREALAGLGVIAAPQILPLRDQSIDLIASVFALHLVNDLPGTLIQARRALKPDGLFMACLPGGQTLHELRHCLTQAESEITGGASPHVLPFADLRDLGGLLQRAGFALPVTDIEVITVRYDTMFALMRDLRCMGATNVLLARSRKPMRRDVFLRAAQIYAARFADADGRIRATFEIIWASGWAPHDSQQRPLRPGSARMRLADALGTQEVVP